MKIVSTILVFSVISFSVGYLLAFDSPVLWIAVAFWCLAVVGEIIHERKVSK